MIIAAAVTCTACGETVYINNAVDIEPGGFYQTMTVSYEPIGSSSQSYFYQQKCTIIPTIDNETGLLTLELVDVTFAKEMEPLRMIIANIPPSQSLENTFTSSSRNPIIDGETNTNYNITNIQVKYDNAILALDVYFTCVTDAPIYGIGQYEVRFIY